MQQVERLVGPAELDVGAHRDRVVALQHRVEQLEQRDRLVGREALGEVVAREQLRDRRMAREAEQVLHRHVEPLGVVAHLEVLVVHRAAPWPPGAGRSRRWRRSPRPTAPGARPSGPTGRRRARCSRRRSARRRGRRPGTRAASSARPCGRGGGRARSGRARASRAADGPGRAARRARPGAGNRRRCGPGGPRPAASRRLSIRPNANVSPSRGRSPRWFETRPEAAVPHSQKGPGGSPGKAGSSPLT